MPRTAWSLVSVRPARSVTPVVGALTADGQIKEILELSAYTELVAVLESWEEIAPVMRELDPGQNETLEGATLLPPLRYPRKLICAGANYADHLNEMGITEIPSDIDPYFFLLPATSIVGPGEAVVIPEDTDFRVDWEAELAVVIGRLGRNISQDNALDHVAGYSILNDISARGRHARRNALAPPFAYDWLGSKGLDTFSPMGPGVTPAWFISDPQNLNVRLWLNDQLKQDGKTSGMIFPVAQLIAAASSVMTLQPGDVIATGTPAGVGVARGDSLNGGDRLTVEIAPLGRLVNPVVTAAPAETSPTRTATTS